MAQATITVNRLKPFEIAGDIAAQITFNHEAFFRDSRHHVIDLLLGHVVGPHIGIQFQSLDNCASASWTDPVDIPQGVFDFLFAGYVDPK